MKDMTSKEISHVNQVWRQMRRDLNIHDTGTNYLEIDTLNHEYSMCIILLNRKDFMAKVLFKHNFDEFNKDFHPWLDLMGFYCFLDVDWLKDVAYDFACIDNPNKETKTQAPFWEYIYSELIHAENKKINFIKRHKYLMEKYQI